MITMANKKRKTIKDLVKFGCWCSVCTPQDVTDNFKLVGKDNFTKLALSALEISKIKPEDC